MRKFIIDTDTAADDAAAIVYMLRQKDIEIKAITTVSGNVNAHQATLNALSSVEAANTYAPDVYTGCTIPMIKQPYYAMNVHGGDGLGDSGILPSRLRAKSAHAVDVICDIIRQNPHEIELLTLGPLTNIALCYLKYPEIAGLVKNVVVMGGSGFEKGNVTDYAEFNIYVDAEAAKVVISGGMPITLVGCELSTDECALDSDDAERLKSCSDYSGRFVYEVTKRLRAFDLETYGRDEIFIPDAVAAAVALDSTFSSELEPVFADVEIKDEARYGQIMMLRSPEKPNAYLAHKLDSQRFKRDFFASLERK